MRSRHLTNERHNTQKIGWLRAAVLGANDGIVSTASLILGVAAAHGHRSDILVAGVSGLAAGAMAMAAGEYVSVSSQADTEKADLNRERRELNENIEDERRELAQIYVARGLNADLAKQVAHQLMEHDALGAHARDELGISESVHTRPVQAAITSAVSFSVGAALPLVVSFLIPAEFLMGGVSGASLLLLTCLGWLAAKVGGANAWRGAFRVLLWGSLAMLITSGVGKLFS